VTALTALHSPLVGLVTELDEQLAAPDDARLPHLLAAASADGPTGGGAGYAAGRDVARRAALGEVAERHAAACVPDEELVLASAEELGEQAIDPARFALFAPEQYARPGFPFSPFTRSTRIRWARGRALADGRRVFLPAQLVYLPWRRRVDGEVAIGYSTSSGLACGDDETGATLAALLELVERDAFMIVWNTRLSLPLLIEEPAGELARFEERFLAPTLLRHRLVDLSPFLDVPVVLASVRAHRRGPGELGIGAGAAPTPTTAAKKALAEAYAVRSAAGRLWRLGPRRFRNDFGDVTTFDDHVHVYADPQRAVAAAFLEASSTRRLLSEVRPLEGLDDGERLASLLQRLAVANLEAYAVDVTSHDIREAGLTVVRAVVPELCPLDVRHDARFLGGARLRSEPSRLGFRPRPLRHDELNPDPHPFP
jgi:ribosomal protein S12 methylthiotransferase accessory factor